MELQEEKQTLEEMLKERNAKVEEGRDSVTAGGGVTRQAPT